MADDEKLLQTEADENRIFFEDAIAFPGLINSHDHLDFNLFPRLGNRIYKNYVEWGADIQSQNKEIIAAIIKIPKKFRIEWGIYKNLLNGITTVINHGEKLNIEYPIIDIFQHCHSLHSVRREKFWNLKLNNPFAKNYAFVIHIGEGTDNESFKEINKLISWNLFNRKLICVHGVAMNTKQAEKFKALIWCPASNFFLLNATANVRELKNRTKILFGTDSTLTANWNLWEQVRLARRTGMLTDEELFSSLTNLPASLWKLNDRGMIGPGKYADIVIARNKRNNNILKDFFHLNPEEILLVLKAGEVILFDEILLSQLKPDMKDFSIIFINEHQKYVKGNLPALMNEIRKYNSDISFPVSCD